MNEVPSITLVGDGPLQLSHCNIIIFKCESDCSRIFGSGELLVGKVETLSHDECLCIVEL